MKTDPEGTMTEAPSTALAERAANGQSLTVPPDYVPVAGLNDLSPDDFTLPTLKLTQAQSTQEDADKNLGKWYRRDTGEYYTDPNLLILGIAKSRVMFPAEYSGDSEPLCRSDNSQQPRAEYIGSEIDYKGSGAVIGDACADCPFSRWGDNDEPPPCTLTENWAALTDNGDPVIIRLSRSGAKASSQLKNLSRAAALKKRPMYINLSSRSETGKRGRYYVPVISTADSPPSDELLSVAKSLIGINLAARAAESVDQADAVEGEAHPF